MRCLFRAGSAGMTTDRLLSENRATFERSWRTLASPLTCLTQDRAGGPVRQRGQVGSGASQGMEADTQWVMGAVWSVLWRCRGGWAKVV